MHDDLTSKYVKIRGVIVEPVSITKPSRVFGICLLLLLTSSASVVTGQQIEEDQNFQPVHTATDFPVAWDDSSLSGDPVRMIYPAMNDGESKEMAGNGPFPWVVFFGDIDEDVSDYMLLAAELVKRGNIVVVTQGVDQDESDNVQEHLSLLEKIMLFMQENNNSNTNVQGSFGQIDLNHWGIGGHGTGAAAAYSAYPFWHQSSLATTTQPPRALFGLGTDFSDWDSGQDWDSLRPAGWTVQPAWPQTALFMTGTIDEIARGQDNLPFINGTELFGWQWMHILGANHYQFQDETDDGFLFGDDRNDGDASLSRQEQIDYTALHLNPYLDVTLRGDHSSFRDAFNRQQDLFNASDQDSYVEDDLDDSHLLLLTNTSVNPTNVTILGRYDTFSIQSNWSLRDGSIWSELPSSWQIDIECGIDDLQQSVGYIDGEGIAICDFQVENIAPGQHVAYMRIFVEGAPSTTEFEFIRGDTPLVFMTPLPEILVPERGEAHLDSNLIAMDPDGQEIFVVSAIISGGNVNNFSVEVDSDGRGITVFHNVEGEFIGGAEVEVVVRSGGQGVVDENQATLEIMVVPFNDRVVLTGTVAMQNLVEDGTSVFVNISEYAYDPEGQPLLASINDATSGQAGPVSFSFANGVLELTPLENANGATVLHVRVTDGGSEPVEVDIPVQVAPVDDAVIANQSMWSLELIEDEALSFDLTQFAWDIDGDQLVWQTSPIMSDSPLSVVVAGSEMIVSPDNDVNGLNQLHWLNVSDGNSDFSRLLSVNITPVPDAPVLTLYDVNVIDDTAVSLAWWIFDADGTDAPEPEIKADEILLENLTHSCIIDQSDGKYQCVTMLLIPDDHDDNVTLRVAIQDSEFSSEIVSYTSILYNQTTIIDSVEDASDSDELSSGIIIGVIGGLVVLILVLFLFIRTSSNSPTAVVGVDNKQELSVVEQELDVDLSPSGLLSRIQQEKKD